MSRIFQSNFIFNQPLDNWHVSNVVTLQYAFNNAKLFNQPLNDWNVGNVTDLGATFQGANVFNQDLNNWDVSKVTKLWTTFWDAHAFNGDITNWNLPSLQNLNSTFLSAYNLNQDLSNWNTSNVTNFQSTFYAASSFDSDISNWEVSNGNIFAYMFKFAENFNRDLSNWDVSNGNSYAEMFYYASSFNQNIGTWNLENATNLNLFLSNSRMNCENYENSLRGCVSNPNTATGFTNVGVHNVKYDSTAIALRDSVASILNWTLNSDVIEVGCKELPLSIENLEIFAQATAKGVHLLGKYMNNDQNSNWEAQFLKSTDGINFYPIGSTYYTNSFDFFDKHLEDANSIMYQIHLSNNKMDLYSNVITFNNALNQNKISLFPYPSSDFLYIQHKTKHQNVDYTILNAQGISVK